MSNAARSQPPAFSRLSFVRSSSRLLFQPALATRTRVTLSGAPLAIACSGQIQTNPSQPRSSLGHEQTRRDIFPGPARARQIFFVLVLYFVQSAFFPSRARFFHMAAELVAQSGEKLVREVCVA